MKPLRNNWHDPRNVWNIATDSQGKISKASGVYYHNDIMTSFSLLRQPEGRRSAYRGHIEIISQISGNVLVRKYEKDGKYIEKKVRAELNCKDCSEREMKAYIASSAERLYRNYQNEIAADYQSAYNAPVTPNTITPRRAFDKYAPAFLHAKYPRSTDRKKKERLNQLNKFYSGLENIPMCKYSASQLKAYIQSAGIGKETAKLAGDFWNYCLDRLYVSGTNPFPAFADTRISPKALQSKALRANTLSTETFYNLFDLLAVKASGMDCGVALLASGFTAEQICDLRWKNLYFDPSREDFVTVGLFLAERAGAQHNYTRPCIPMTALLLRTLHSELEKKSPKSLKDKSVVTTGSKKTSPGGTLGSSRSFWPRERSFLRGRNITSRGSFLPRGGCRKRRRDTEAARQTRTPGRKTGFRPISSFRSFFGLKIFSRNRIRRFFRRLGDGALLSCELSLYLPKAKRFPASGEQLC